MFKLIILNIGNRLSRLCVCVYMLFFKVKIQYIIHPPLTSNRSEALAQQLSALDWIIQFRGSKGPSSTRLFLSFICYLFFWFPTKHLKDFWNRGLGLVCLNKTLGTRPTTTPTHHMEIRFTNKNVVGPPKPEFLLQSCFPFSFTTAGISNYFKEKVSINRSILLSPFLLSCFLL